MSPIVRRRIEARLLRSLCGLLLLSFVSIIPSFSAENAPVLRLISVIDFGAIGDGHTDNTAAFQKALVVRFHVSASCALTKRAINTVLPIEHDWFFVEFGDVLFQA